MVQFSSPSSSIIWQTFYLCHPVAVQVKPEQKFAEACASWGLSEENFYSDHSKLCQLQRRITKSEKYIRNFVKYFSKLVNEKARRQKQRKSRELGIEKHATCVK